MYQGDVYDESSSSSSSEEEISEEKIVCEKEWSPDGTIFHEPSQAWLLKLYHYINQPSSSHNTEPTYAISNPEFHNQFLEFITDHTYENSWLRGYTFTKQDLTLLRKLWFIRPTQQKGAGRQVNDERMFNALRLAVDTFQKWFLTLPPVDREFYVYRSSPPDRCIGENLFIDPAFFHTSATAWLPIRWSKRSVPTIWRIRIPAGQIALPAFIISRYNYYANGQKVYNFYKPKIKSLSTNKINSNEIILPASSILTVDAVTIKEMCLPDGGSKQFRIVDATYVGIDTDEPGSRHWLLHKQHNNCWSPMTEEFYLF